MGEVLPEVLGSFVTMVGPGAMKAGVSVSMGTLGKRTDVEPRWSPRS